MVRCLFVKLTYEHKRATLRYEILYRGVFFYPTIAFTAQQFVRTYGNRKFICNLYENKNFQRIRIVLS